MADQHPTGAIPPPTSAYEMMRRAPAAGLRGSVTGLVAYRETTPGHFRQTQAASLTIPLVISFGEAFAIGLGRPPTGDDRIASFAAGLFAGPVVIDSFGQSNCIQIDFTPLGARRFLGAPMSALTDRMVTLDDALGSAGVALRDKLAGEADGNRRLDLAEAFVMDRLARAETPRPEISWAYERLAGTVGRARIAAIADEIGWSRKHLARCFADEIGLGPKRVARIMRFNRALDAARCGAVQGWADVAAACGYADQAHLVREFNEFAGSSPAALNQPTMPG